MYEYEGCGICASGERGRWRGEKRNVIICRGRERAERGGEGRGGAGRRSEGEKCDVWGGRAA